MARGHSIEYFIEGGRSRTGRLLQPKTGMLSMTVRSFLRDPGRPVVFIPVYFGYERIVEGSTYIGELSGKPKEKESVLGLLRTFRKLREKFGQVHVNLGEPIRLNELLDRYDADWRTRVVEDDTRVPWVGSAVDDLAVDHHAEHQCRRGRHADQSAGHHAAGDAAAGTSQDGPAAADGSLSRAAAQLFRTATA